MSSFPIGMALPSCILPSNLAFYTTPNVMVTARQPVRRTGKSFARGRFQGELRRNSSSYPKCQFWPEYLPGRALQTPQSSGRPTLLPIPLPILPNYVRDPECTGAVPHEPRCVQERWRCPPTDYAANPSRAYVG